MATETKEIGISLGVGKGMFLNTVYVNGTIQLKEVAKTESNQSIYEPEGYWESEVIDLVDKFKEYDRVVLSKTKMGSDVLGVFTRTSDNGITFDEYVSITETGNIQSTVRQYVQVKIIFYAGYANENFVISNFNSETDVGIFNDTTYIETTNGDLKLKRNYSFNMTKDNSWSNTGELHRKTITRSQWRRIDKLSVE